MDPCLRRDDDCSCLSHRPPRIAQQAYVDGKELTLKMSLNFKFIFGNNNIG
jgi:hypothetical protein